MSSRGPRAGARLPPCLAAGLRPGALRSGLRSGLAGGLKPRPSSWSRSESLMSVMRRRGFACGIGEEVAARLFQVLQRLAQQLGVARGLGARGGERIAQFGDGLFLEREPRFQFHEIGRASWRE